jgi:hypothetical protein
MYNEVITGIDICNYTFCNHYIIIIRSMYVCEHECICVRWTRGDIIISESPAVDSVLSTADVFLSRCVLITNYNNIYMRVLNIVLYPINYNLILLYRVK